MGFGIGLDDVENRKSLPLSDLELRPLGRSARSQSLCRLLYSAGTNKRITRKIQFAHSLKIYRSFPQYRQEM
jgi:hypothetical protein